MSETTRHESSEGTIIQSGEPLCRLDVTIPVYVKAHVKQAALLSDLPVRAFVAEVLAQATAFDSDHDFLTDSSS